MPALAPERRPGVDGASWVAGSEGLVVAYPTPAGGVAAVEDVTLQVRRGEFVTLVGPSGCGKSSWLNAVAGLLPQETLRAGSVGVADGERLGYLFQRETLLPWRSVLGNVELPLELAGVGRGERRERARALIERLGLGGFESAYPRELSGGMRQRVQLARTLLAEPTLVLLDEPLGALDALTRVFMQDELLRVWRASGATFVMVTHDLEEAVAVGTRVVLMSARPGRIVREYAVPLPSDRSALAARTDPRAHDLRAELWRALEEEASLAAR